jgi:hypothetical protein
MMSAPAPDPQKLLEQFVVNNADLERLESLLNQFNIFEAVGMVRQEIHHSRFLAFLLNPNASHHLGDIFLKTFLKRLLLEADNATVSPIEIDVATLTDTEVRREWKNIDILLVSPGSKIVCAIENKVDSGEHSNQLQRYRQIVQKEFADYRQIFVFLTPQGSLPSSEAEQAYWSVYSYDKIAAAIEAVCDRHRATLQPEVCALMQHYSTLINRHLMEDSDIAKLCRDIYLKHQAAIDLIYQHRPDPIAEVQELLRTTVKNTDSEIVVLDHNHAKRGILGFAPPSWDTLPFQKTCKGWTASGRILIFQFKIDPPKVKLFLTLGPGSNHIRQAVFNILHSSSVEGLVNHQPSPTDSWNAVISRRVSEALDPEVPEDSLDLVAQDLRDFWDTFLQEELPHIVEVISSGMSAIDSP